MEIFYEDVNPLNLHKNIIKRYTNQLIIREKYSLGEISSIICSDDYLLKINMEYLNHDYFTDIITFNYNDGKKISGDLFISFDRVEENAKKFRTTLEKELIRVIFHGLLHLVGYNDKTTSEIKVMRSKENFYLREVDFSEVTI